MEAAFQFVRVVIKKRFIIRSNNNKARCSTYGVDAARTLACSITLVRPENLLDRTDQNVNHNDN